MADVVTIREAVQRSKAEGMPVSEYTLRRIIRSGKVPIGGAKDAFVLPQFGAVLDLC